MKISGESRRRRKYYSKLGYNVRDRKACIHQAQNLDIWEALSKTVITMGFKIMLGICLPEQVQDNS